MAHSRQKSFNRRILLPSAAWYIRSLLLLFASLILQLHKKNMGQAAVFILFFSIKAQTMPASILHPVFQNDGFFKSFIRSGSVEICKFSKASMILFCHLFTANSSVVFQTEYLNECSSDAPHLLEIPQIICWISILKYAQYVLAMEEMISFPNLASSRVFAVSFLDFLLFVKDTVYIAISKKNIRSHPLSFPSLHRLHNSYLFLPLKHCGNGK